MNRLKFLFILCALLFGCAGNTKKDAALHDPYQDPAGAKAENTTQSVSIEAKLAAAEQNTSDVTEVRFQKGHRNLLKTYSKKIKDAMIAAQEKSALRHIAIVVWGDNDLQRTPTRENEDEKKLANDRGEVIQAMIHQIVPKLSVDIINMNQKPGKIRKFLRTEDVRIQQVLENAGTGDPKASHAIIIIETQDKK